MRKRGFTLIEVVVAVSIIGFLMVSAFYAFNVVRMNSRDALRVGNIATLSRAMALYQNSSQAGFPASTGECLTGASGVGQALVNAKAIVDIPKDPLWPSNAPTAFSGGATQDYPVNPSADFCYWYYSNSNTSYYLSYYLESTSKSGNQGIHVVSGS